MAASFLSRAPVLLNTKMLPPAVRGRLISRAALLDRLRRGAAGRLTLVVAPAGWGKTSLLCDWHANEVDARIAWLSLDGSDNDPARFWTYVVAALHNVTPSITLAPQRATQSMGTSLDEAFLASLLNEIENSHERVILVLDDYHVVRSPLVHEAIALLIARLPPTMHLVLATRSEPPLPLARLRASGELNEIRSIDLQFSEDEAAGLLRGIVGSEIEPDDVARLRARTEGWAAGLCLAGLSMRGREDLRAFVDQFAGNDRHVVDYLGSEVLEDLPRHLRRFLLRTSVLDQLCAPLCDAVTGEHNASDLLSELERSNAFVVRLDSRREWFRYHHLFAELLRHELARSEPDLPPELHRRAGSVVPATRGHRGRRRARHRRG